MKSHVVNKVSLQMPATDYAHARKLQQEAQYWANHYLPTLLNQSLDAISEKEEFLFIDKIEIEIPELPWKISDAAWKEKITQQILQQRFTKLPIDVIIKQWLFYLKNGVFEQTAILKHTKEIESLLLNSETVFTAKELNNLREIFSSANAIKRLFFSHSEKFVAFLLSLVLKIDQPQSENIYTNIHRQLTHNIQETQLILQQLLKAIHENNQQKKDEIFELLIKNQSIQIKEWVAKKKMIENNISIANENTTAGTYLSCVNAGMVLLLPFITRFFENIRVTENNIFISEQLKTKALQALHFLATGKNAENEQDLLLPKIFCGIEINEYVEIKDEPDEQIKKEANELLESVITHWQVLKNSSVTALQETFLQREGRLLMDANYLVQVSNAGVDVLLDKIPWGFRNYKLPWMHKTIITEWH